MTNVSTVEIVNAKPKVTIINDKNSVCSLSSNEKKPKSGITFASTEIATRPENPIKKTMGIMIKNETNKLFLKVS